MPTRKEWPEQLLKIARERVELSARKNANYSGGTEDDDAFQNFNLIELLTHGKVTREIGLLVRISDKIARLANLMTGAPDLVGESIEDTLRDLSNYSDILLAAHREKSAQAVHAKDYTGEYLPGDDFPQEPSVIPFGRIEEQMARARAKEAAAPPTAWQRLVDAMKP